VDHALAMGAVEGTGHLAGQLDGLFYGKLGLLLEPLAQGLAGHVGHDVVEQAVHFTGVMQRKNVRVAQRRRYFDLAEEPLAAERGGQIGAQHLERHLAVVLEVVGQIDHGHAAATDLTLDGVAVGHGGLEPLQQVGHRTVLLT